MEADPGCFQRIHILGASGSGTTTLARALCKVLPHVHFDSDDFFWKTKFSKIQPRAQRLSKLRRALTNKTHWILSGSVIDWGTVLAPLFEAVLFLSVPNDKRLNRLALRETRRYGTAILSGGEMCQTYQDFMEWAGRYETGGDEVRSRFQQERWLEKLSCPVLRIDGDLSVEENVVLAFDFLKTG